MFFNTYRKVAKSLEGSGLSKIPFIRGTHKRLIRSLAPEIVSFDSFKLKHLGQLDQESKLFLNVLKENIRGGGSCNRCWCEYWLLDVLFIKICW